MQGFYGSGVHSNMLMGALQGRSFPSMLPNYPGFSPPIQPANQMEAYKQQMMRLTGFSGLQNPLLSMTSSNPLMLQKPGLPSFGATGLPFTALNPLMSATSGLSALAQAKNLASMTSPVVMPSSGKTPGVSQPAVNKNSLSQSLSSSPASSNDSDGSPDNNPALSNASPSNLTSVAMQNDKNIKLAEMVEKYKQVQAASRDFQNKMLPQQPGLLGNSIFSYNGRFRPFNL